MGKMMFGARTQRGWGGVIFFVGDNGKRFFSIGDGVVKWERILRELLKLFGKN